jgi:hypothetical protein
MRLPPVGYANDLMVVVWVRLPFAKRLEEKARYANDFGCGIDRCLDSIAVGTLRERVLVGSILHRRGSANES